MPSVQPVILSKTANDPAARVLLGVIAISGALLVARVYQLDGPLAAKSLLDQLVRGFPDVPPALG